MSKNDDLTLCDYLNFDNYKRVLKLAVTPKMKEFFDVAKVVLAGLVISGLIGFTIFLSMDLIPM